MNRITCLPVLCALVCLGPSAANAGVIVNTTIGMTSFSITPSSGTVQIVPPTTATVFATAADSLGGADSQFDSQDDTSVAVSALVALAAANASADAVAFTASAFSSVHIPDFEASANSTGLGSLSGFFQITGASGPVSVVISAALSLSQSLITTNLGLDARSETIFTLLLPDVSSSPVLFRDDLHEIGPNGSFASSSTPSLSTTLTLDPDTPYFFVLEVDSESSGLTAPEPSCFALAALGTCLAFVRRYRAR